MLVLRGIALAVMALPVRGEMASTAPVALCQEQDQPVVVDLGLTGRGRLRRRGRIQVDVPELLETYTVLQPLLDL